MQGWFGSLQSPYLQSDSPFVVHISGRESKYGVQFAHAGRCRSVGEYLAYQGVALFWHMKREGIELVPTQALVSIDFAIWPKPQKGQRPQKPTNY
jgi:hypothetical protein